MQDIIRGMQNIIIEKMTIQDLEEIKEKLEVEFDDFWNYNILKNEIESENTNYLVAKAENEIVAFAGVTFIIDVAELNNIVVKKSFRGNGISKLLLQALVKVAEEKKCRQINLEVSKINTVAINLYVQFEFKQVGERKKYYNGQDALLFTKEL